jgi:NIPSNAP
MFRISWAAGLILACAIVVFGLERRAAMASKGKENARPSELIGAKPADSPDRVFELRTYYVNEGKLDDLHKRFRDHTCQLLKKHGAELVGFWTPLDEKDGKGRKLIYLVAFPSREQATKTWKAFSDDPEWKRVYEESHKNGVLVDHVDRVFLEPADYSALK